MSNLKKVALYTLGCKLNFSETSAIGRQFESAGYSKVDFDQEADVYILNTCSVTDNADKKCRSLVRKLEQQAPDSKIVIIGCYAQLQPEEIASIPGVDLVLGAKEKFNVLEYVNDLDENTHNCQVFASDIEAIDNYNDAWSYGDRTRTFLKVQDGCDYSCAFCTIPLARGRSRSLSIDSVMQNARKIAATDVKEIVLTGVNTGDFGKGPHGAPRPGESFLDLIKALDEIEEINRIRISSIEPNLLSKEIIQLVANSQRFMPHFHIPLQSGSNKMLKAMRRRYLRELYAERVEQIKAAMPHACIGVDVIVGFPGETEADFLETYEFLNELDISYLHVFTYSERPNTLAVEMPGIVPMEERRKRSKMLRSLSVKKRRYFYKQFINTERPVLFESENKQGYIYGFTDNYIKIKHPFDALLCNTIQELPLEKLTASGEMWIPEFSQNYTIQTS
ncbi:MAG: tRNA (N(6)-L-threonylcarbamoyladenosine(37)-C(2))-methylthiotransferase MtaB [Chitinophagales bacterium]